MHRTTDLQQQGMGTVLARLLLPVFEPWMDDYASCYDVELFSDERRALEAACARGDLRAVKRALERGRVALDHRFSGLSHALRKRRYAVLELLLADQRVCNGFDDAWEKQDMLALRLLANSGRRVQAIFMNSACNAGRIQSMRLLATCSDTLELNCYADNTRCHVLHARLANWRVSAFTACSAK